MPVELERDRTAEQAMSIKKDGNIKILNNIIIICHDSRTEGRQKSVTSNVDKNKTDNNADSIYPSIVDDYGYD